MGGDEMQEKAIQNNEKWHRITFTLLSLLILIIILILILLLLLLIIIPGRGKYFSPRISTQRRAGHPIASFVVFIVVSLLPPPRRKAKGGG